MSASKLGIYNMALGHLRERRLASLSEAREPRRVLDSFWDQVVAEGIAEGLWNFMVRTVQIDSSTSVAPAFSYTYAFQIPTDRARTVMVSTSPTLMPPLLDYVEEAGYWYAWATPLYVRYISDDPAYGSDLSLWTPYFTAFVTLRLAEYACSRITGAETMLQGPNGISERCRKAKTRAKSNDAMNQPPGQTPLGSWATSRVGFLDRLPMPGGDMFDD